MKKEIENYCSKVQKETEKLLYKMFGKKQSIKQYIAEKERIREGIEGSCGKPLSEVSELELHIKRFYEEYAKYKTLEKILKIYEESVCLSLSNRG